MGRPRLGKWGAQEAFGVGDVRAEGRSPADVMVNAGASRQPVPLFAASVSATHIRRVGGRDRSRGQMK